MTDDARRNDSRIANTPHNGWPNRPTWCANLWLTNDEAPYNRARQAAIAAAAMCENIGDAAAALAPRLCIIVRSIDGAAEDIRPGWRHVNWQHIAETFIRDHLDNA